MRVHFKKNSIYLELHTNSGIMGDEDRKEECFIENTLGFIKGKECRVLRVEDSFGNIIGLTIEAIKSD